MLRLLFLFLCLTLRLYGAKPPPAAEWYRYDDCSWVENDWNDGDSFHVRTPDGSEHIFRLYFVDTPEAEGSLPERLAEQAEAFQIPLGDVIQLGKKASSFTRAKLCSRPFTVWTRWKQAPGRSKLVRYYAIVQIDGQYLQDALVKAHLARIHGVRTPLPDGRDSRQYLEVLKSATP